MQRREKLSIFLVAGLMMIGSFAYAQSTDFTSPSIPTGLSVSLPSPSEVQVSWTASTDNVGVAGYYVYRGGIGVGNATNTTFTDIVPPGAYSYTVAAYDAAGNVSLRSSPSPLISVVKDTTPLPVPTWISVTPATSSVALSWNAPTGNFSVIGYYLYRNGAKISMPDALTATTYTDTGLPSGSTLTYVVVAYDAVGNQSNSNSIHVTTISDITPPSTPSLSTPVAKSSSQLDFSWSPSADNIGVVGYYVYRSGSQIADVSSTQTAYSDTNLSPGTNYWYMVAAYDAAGNVSAQSLSVEGMTLPPDTVPPTEPNYFAVKAISTSEIDLAWQASADNIGVAGYHVYRNDTLIADTTSTFYADIGLATDTIYEYAVEAYDAGGNLSAQTSAYTTTFSTNPTVPTSTAPAAPTSVGPAVFNTPLYFSLQSDDVETLQLFLIQKGYLGSGYATGFFGTLTQKAVQQFQCDQNIVCAGDPQTTGWGSVGAATRQALNALYNSGQTTTSVTSGGTVSAAARLQQLEAQLQALQAQLQNLQGY